MDVEVAKNGVAKYPDDVLVLVDEADDVLLGTLMSIDAKAVVGFTATGIREGESSV